MTIYSDNYAFDFYTWAHDIQCAEKVAKEFAAMVMKRKKAVNRKALILRAIQTNNYVNYPDSESPSSIDTMEFNEIHSMTESNIIINKSSCFSKIKCCSIL
jgi:LPS sulfotransferase NodH